MRWCSTFQRCSMRRCSCASPSETPDDAPRLGRSTELVRYHYGVRQSNLDWESIDTVLLDMDGTLLDQRFDNWFWQECVPDSYAEEHGLSLPETRQILEPKFRAMRGTIQWYCIDYW